MLEVGKEGGKRANGAANSAKEAGGACGGGGWEAEAPHVNGQTSLIEGGLTLVRREYPTAIGPIDLVCRDPEDAVVAVEVKRRGEIDGVEQLARYIERLELDSSLGEIRGVFVAQSIKPQAKVLAESRGFRWVEVDYDQLRGMAPDDLRLF